MFQSHFHLYREWLHADHEYQNPPPAPPQSDSNVLYFFECLEPGFWNQVMVSSPGQGAKIPPVKHADLLVLDQQGQMWPPGTNALRSGTEVCITSKTDFIPIDASSAVFSYRKFPPPPPPHIAHKLYSAPAYTRCTIEDRTTVSQQGRLTAVPGNMGQTRYVLHTTLKIPCMIRRPYWGAKSRSWFEPVPADFAEDLARKASRLPEPSEYRWNIQRR
ncbi:uncharacterized protein BXZ73DRAFT_74044 [Epithele typhae]|uniref:uncharacterized protein n=1 Tax=Epithele typhae TaxID=378194 RepID=UPI0020072B39|nr:uncharacterized protein BXZ73DRAFT_74044 [Epithele typhae]KAH9944559.1 hypothetical protein BXZ73DRAFT_74044 [Epithele typhae]